MLFVAITTLSSWQSVNPTMETGEGVHYPVAFSLLCFLLFASERRNQLSSSLKQFLSIDQDHSTAPSGFIVGFTGNTTLSRGNH